jgi:peptide/nickel transport system permease protein
VQYIDYIGQILHGNFGMSIEFSQSTTSLYFSSLPNTLALAGLALLIDIVGAIALGTLAARYRNKVPDKITRMLAVLGVSVPEFWLGLTLIQVFAVKLAWLPAGGMGSFSSYILPAFTLATFGLAAMTRLLRSSMIDVLESEFIKVCRADGATERSILLKHGLRNAAIPVLSFLGVQIALMMGGSVVVEDVFAWPGVGRLLYEGLQARDFPLVQAIAILTGALVILASLLTDIIYCMVDPRIRLQ